MEHAYRRILEQLLGKAFKSDVIPVEVCVHGVINIRDVVFHTVTFRIHK